MSLYTDRCSHYFHMTKAGEIDRAHLTQVGRALKQLGVEHIGAFSPQARGRSERAFGTLQDRLVKELKLAGVTGVEEANAFIRDVYLPAYNARFAVEPAGEGSAFTPIPGVDLDEILCVQEERQVGNDNCVSYRTLKLQIPPSPMRSHFVKAKVRVHLRYRQYTSTADGHQSLTNQLLPISALSRRRKTIESTWIWAELRRAVGWGFPRLLLMAITAA